MTIVDSTILYTCGCTSVFPLPSDASTCQIPMQEPGGTDIFGMEIVRVSDIPSVFVEAGSPRPDWATTCHVMVWFDVRVFGQANQREFDHLFKPFRDQFGPLVPACWLPDIMRGSGRFFGLWRSQKPAPGRPVQHLRLLDTPKDGPELVLVPE